MKKVSLLLVSIALFGFISLNSCKTQSAQPVEETTEEVVVEEVVVEEAEEVTEEVEEVTEEVAE